MESDDPNCYRFSFFKRNKRRSVSVEQVEGHCVDDESHTTSQPPTFISCVYHDAGEELISMTDEKSPLGTGELLAHRLGLRSHGPREAPACTLWELTEAFEVENRGQRNRLEVFRMSGSEPTYKVVAWEHRLCTVQPFGLDHKAEETLLVRIPAVEGLGPFPGGVAAMNAALDWLCSQGKGRVP